MKLSIKLEGPAGCGKTHTLGQIEHLLQLAGWGRIKIKHDLHALTAEKGFKPDKGEEGWRP